MRLGIILAVVNYLAFGMFLFLRPSESARLERKDLLMAGGQYELNSGDPWTYIAARPLYNWSEWHGGERRWVKVIEMLNWPPLVLAAVATEAVGGTFWLGYLRASWLRASLFLVLSTGQWVLLGLALSRAHRQRRLSKAVA